MKIKLQPVDYLKQLGSAFITQIEHKIHINYYDKIVWATKYNNSVGVKYSEFDGDIEQATCAAIHRCAESVDVDQAVNKMAGLNDLNNN